jgi:two-component system, OmpR family, response regulator MprA
MANTAPSMPEAPAPGTRILVVDDNRDNIEIIATRLRHRGYEVEEAMRGEEALQCVRKRAPDLILLDVMLPGIDGFQTCRRLREDGVRTPVLMLTARDALRDRVAGLDAGADDYLVKPFAYEELAARLRALDRRALGRAQAEQPMVSGSIVLDRARRVVEVAGRPVDLTRREFNLLECFLRHPGQVLSRDQLLDMAWPFGNFVSHNTVESYVGFLRTKLGPQAGARIETVRGFGYRLTEE